MILKVIFPTNPKCVFAANDTSTDRLALIESQFEGYRFIKGVRVI
jgi:hypothetical protein